MPPMKVPQTPSMWMCKGRAGTPGKIAGAAEKGNDSSLLRCVFRLRYHGPTPACFSMSKESKFKQQQMRVRIAAAAARMMAEDGLDDFALAKRKAARQLVAEDTQALPKNEEIEAELRAYQSLYQGEEQRERIHYLGERARAVSVLKLDWQGVLVNLAIYGLKEERGTLKTTLAGRPIERAGIQAVTQLLSQGCS